MKALQLHARRTTNITFKWLKIECRDGEVRGQGIADIGSGNIFETMFAMQDLVEAGEINSRMD